MATITRAQKPLKSHSGTISPKKSTKTPQNHPKQTQNVTDPVKKRESPDEQGLAQTQSHKKKKRRRGYREKPLPPIGPKPGTPAFAKLQREWYAKLKATGFEDIESFTGKNCEPADLLVGRGQSGSIKASYKPETLHYYRRWDCFIVNNPRFSRDKRIRYIARLHAKGATFRETIKLVNARYPDRKAKLNLLTLHKLLKALKERVANWNKNSPKGLDYTPPDPQVVKLK